MCSSISAAEKTKHFYKTIISASFITLQLVAVLLLEELQLQVHHWQNPCSSYWALMREMDESRSGNGSWVKHLCLKWTRSIRETVWCFLSANVSLWLYQHGSGLMSGWIHLFISFFCPLRSFLSIRLLTIKSDRWVSFVWFLTRDRCNLRSTFYLIVLDPSQCPLSQIRLMSFFHFWIMVEVRQVLSSRQKRNRTNSLQPH